jgi:hypothetical protein
VDVWVRASKWDEDGRWEMIVRSISGGMVVREDILISEEQLVAVLPKRESVKGGGRLGLQNLAIDINKIRAT